jgi:hypothetical protein
MRAKPYRSMNLEKRLLEELVRRGGTAHRTRDRDVKGRTLSEAVADRLKISKSELQGMVKSSDGRPGSGWQNDLDWAASRLRKRGYLQPSLPGEKGVWKVNPKIQNTLGKLASENGVFEKDLDEIDEILWDIKFKKTSGILAQFARDVRKEYREGKTMPFDLGRL